MSSSQPIDIVVEVINSLAQQPETEEELADRLWGELRSPLATLPSVKAVVRFLERKELVSRRKGVVKLSKEGKKIAKGKLPSPRSVSYYQQVLEAGRLRRAEVIRLLESEERLKVAQKDLTKRVRQRRARRARDLEGAGDIIFSI